MKKACLIALLVVLGLPAAAAAADAPAPTGVLSLNASASVEVPKDLLMLSFGAAREGADAASVQAGLKQALDAALAEAKKAARPGAVDVRTGNFAVYPRYTNKGQSAGWQGNAELLVEGKDMNAIAQLAGRITSMTIARVAYGLSREARDKVDTDVTAQAIARFRAKAGEVAQQFGYGGYVVREVNVSANEAPQPYAARAMGATMSSATSDPLPIEAGKAQVVVTVSGNVQMTK